MGRRWLSHRRTIRIAAPMRILLTNDDGIHAPGFAVLEAIAAKLSDDVWAVAPAEEQSGAGHSLTLTRPIRLRRHGERRFSVSGTPTDAVMMALAHVMKDRPPDLILSGVNRGANLAEDVTYSGTVSAAMEGALAGVRSIALSQAYAREGMGDTVPFAAAEAWAERVLRPLIDAPFTPGTLVNVNFPALPPDDGQRRSGVPPGHPRLWPAADRRADRPARLSLLLVRACPDGRNARPCHRPRSGRRRLSSPSPPCTRPDARTLACRAGQTVRDRGKNMSAWHQAELQLLKIRQSKFSGDAYASCIISISCIREPNSDSH